MPKRSSRVPSTIDHFNDAQSETPAALAPWSRMPSMLTTIPSAMAAPSSPDVREAKADSASAQRDSAPRTEARPGRQAKARKTSPPIIRVIER